MHMGCVTTPVRIPASGWFRDIVLFSGRFCFIVATLSCFYLRAGDKLGTLVESLPRFPIRINEVEERIARWRVSTTTAWEQTLRARFGLSVVARESTLSFFLRNRARLLSCRRAGAEPLCAASDRVFDGADAAERGLGVPNRRDILLCKEAFYFTLFSYF